MSRDIINRIGAQAIIDACNSSTTFKEACEKLGCGYRYLVMAATKLGCYEELNQRSKEFSHKGTKFDKPWIIKINTSSGIVFKVDAKIWCEHMFNGDIQSTAVRIKKRLIEAGYKENRCECCGLTDWNGKPISLQLHHIDGNPQNNKINNLMILCPNCHTQTDNYGSKNASKKECQVDL